MNFAEGFVSSYTVWCAIVAGEICSESCVITFAQGAPLPGASVYDFVDSRAQGTFQGRQYSSPDLTSAHLPNHVPTEHCSWVTTEVEQLVSTGCITRWADVADTSLCTKPHMVLPLGVGPKEPRLIWDTRWIHRRRVHSPLYHGWGGKSSSVRVTRGSPGDNRS